MCKTEFLINKKHCKFRKQNPTRNEQRTAMRAIQKIADSIETGVQILVGKREITVENEKFERDKIKINQFECLLLMISKHFYTKDDLLKHDSI